MEEREVKTRRVTVTLEIETDVDLAMLRSGRWWDHYLRMIGAVNQAQANVIRKPRVPAPKNWTTKDVRRVHEKARRHPPRGR